MTLKVSGAGAPEQRILYMYMNVHVHVCNNLLHVAHADHFHSPLGGLGKSYVCSMLCSVGTSFVGLATQD